LQLLFCEKLQKNNSATTEAKENISTYLESLEFWKYFVVCLTKIENHQILLNKISNRFLATTKLGKRVSLPTFSW
jgi:hypothetical protein